MSIVAGAATALSLIYLILAIKNNPLCFWFGAASALLWAYETFYVYHLVFDAGLQLFYVVMSLLGIYRWSHGGTENDEKPITQLSYKQHGAIIVIGFLVSAIFVYLSRFIELINYPTLDAITTVFLVIGTLLLVERKLSSWLYLVIADLVYIYIYGTQGAWLFAAMMLIYSIFGLAGYYSWRTILKKNTTLAATF